MQPDEFHAEMGDDEYFQMVEARQNQREGMDR
jgi:hypothetical protein